MTNISTQQPPNARNWLIKGAVGVALLILVFIAYREIFAARVKIVTEGGGKIFVTTNRDEDMEQIGTGEATYKAYGGKGELFILVENGEQKTLTSATLEPRKTKEVSVELKELANPKQVADSALAFPHRETDFIFGLNPVTQSITYRPTGTKTNAGVSYLSLPKAFSVTWKDRRNFIFNTNSGGVKLFSNGKVASIGVNVDSSDRQQLGIDDKPGRSGAFLINPTKSGISDPYFTDYTASTGVKQYFVMNSQGVYFAGNGLKTDKLKSVYTFEEADQANQLFQDTTYTYVASYAFEEHEEEEPEDTKNLTGEGLVEDAHDPIGVTIRVFKFDGSFKETIDLPIAASVTAVVSLSDNKGYGIQTTEGFYQYDSTSKQLTKNPMYFEEIIDVIRDGSSIIMLNTEGLWQYQDNNLYLLAGPIAGNSFTPSSLTRSGKSILFSSFVQYGTLRSKGNRNASATYTIPMSSN